MKLVQAWIALHTDELMADWVLASSGDNPSLSCIGAQKENAVKTPVKTPEAILAILADNPRLTLAEVAGKTGKSLSAVERANAKLVKQGRLRYVGPRKGGRWEVLE